MRMNDLEFLDRQIETILRFYRPFIVASDESASAEPIPHTLTRNGEVVGEPVRHLVSATRHVINGASLMRYGGDSEARKWCLRALRDVERDHLGGDGKTLVWEVRREKKNDDPQKMYGWAFAILMAANLVSAGFESWKVRLAQFDARARELFWLADDRLFADERRRESMGPEPYRGQNANMHACEAYIFAFEATLDRSYLETALGIARKFCVDFCALSNGWIAEHYDEAWQADWEFHSDQPNDLYRPWGYQIGHQIEWAKLLCMLARHGNESWMIDRAAQLFRAALDRGWDQMHGGLVYGVDHSLEWCDDHKHFWVQAEAIAAAALLSKATGHTDFRQAYDRLWTYVDRHFVDHEYGAWHRIFNRDHSVRDPLKASPGGKVDYHNLLACLEARRALAAPAGQW
jgi:mannose/cellobiose epimerase-like protein (N-acyl-D-glucosamine 2-epimerase family)